MADVMVIAPGPAVGEPAGPVQPALVEAAPAAPAPAAPLVAEVVRSRLVESRHHGTVVGVDAAGRLALTVGSPGDPVFPRSSLKPVQAVGLLRAGMDELFRAPGGPAGAGGTPAVLLAAVTGSHSGERVHLAAVRAVLAAAGVTEDALGCPPDLPLAPRASEDHLRSGGRPQPLLMNCSGKHAGMIATCVAAGWPVHGYTQPDHPVQKAVRAAVEDLAGEPVGAVAVDGCGAPLFAVSLTGLARALRTMVTAAPGTPEHRVAAAMRAHPELVGGTGRTDTELMRTVPGLVAKDGAEGVTAAVAPDGRAAAVKISDGAKRPAVPVLLAALSRLGVLADLPVLDQARLAALAAPPVFGGGRPVGAVRVCHPELLPTSPAHT